MEIVHRQLPGNLQPEDAEHFRNNAEVGIEPPQLQRLGSGHFLSSSQTVYDRRGRLQSVSVSSEQDAARFGRRFLWTQRLLRTSHALKLPLVVVTDKHSANYYRWHAEALPNIVHFLGSPEARASSTTSEQGS